MADFLHVLHFGWKRKPLLYRWWVIWWGKVVSFEVLKLLLYLCSKLHKKTKRKSNSKWLCDVLSSNVVCWICWIATIAGWLLSSQGSSVWRNKTDSGRIPSRRWSRSGADIDGCCQWGIINQLFVLWTAPFKWISLYYFKQHSTIQWINRTLYSWWQCCSTYSASSWLFRSTRPNYPCDHSTGNNCEVRYIINFGSLFASFGR